MKELGSADTSPAPELYNPVPSTESLQVIAQAMGAAGFEHYTEGRPLVKRLIPAAADSPDIDIVEHQGMLYAGHGAAGFEHYTEGRPLVKRLIPAAADSSDIDIVEHQGMLYAGHGAAGFEHYTEGRPLLKRLIPATADSSDIDIVEHQGMLYAGHGGGRLRALHGGTAPPETADTRHSRLV
ncbi:S-layer domain-containing protein [Operophtera brumata]|uniref:S-layer domain-containing protein n=1 Tax=Operophtera brumata TaxID=104452 RepID=A0A0L7LPD5_OPEBR|nr:S-layer domain-containing protein [Operophtera brumata]